MTTTTMTIRVSAELKERLERLADGTRRSRSFLAAEAVEAYVDREEARESFRAEALTSWTEYRETGQHLTGAELARWLETWGTDNEGECPPCHG